MKKISLEKVTLNIGVGAGGEPLENARALLEKIGGQKPVTTTARARNPSFKIRKGDAIGVKVTLRGAKAGEVLKKALEANDFRLSEKSFDGFENAAFGVKEYIDFPGMRYDPKIGMLGFDVCVTLSKPGARVARRRIGSRKVPAKNRVRREEAIAFLKENYGALIE